MESLLKNKIITKNTEEKTEEPAQKKRTQKKRGKVDFILLIAVLVLALLGLYMVLSTTYYKNEVNGTAPLNSFIRQCVFFAIGAAAMAFFATRKDYMWIKKIAPWLYAVGVALLVLVAFVGSDANGAGRWLYIGFNFQPSEFVKFSTIIALAAFISKYSGKYKKSVLFFPEVLILFIPLFLIYLQPHMSMAFIIAVAGIAVIFINGVNMWLMAGTAVVGGFAVFWGIRDEEFRMTRILSYFSSSVDASGVDLQQVQAQYAFAAGNWLGKGMNYSKQKYGFLPMSESDFVFSIIGEELGFIGIALLLAVYVVVIYRGIKIAMNCRNRFGGNMAFGITMILVLQALINMMVACGIMPTTGQPLPFVSLGGTSLVSYMAAYGILLNISKDIPE